MQHFSRAKFEQQQAERREKQPKFPPSTARGPRSGRPRPRGPRGPRGLPSSGRGPSRPPRPPPTKLSPFQSFPLNRDLVLDLQTKWPHYSGPKVLPNETTFQQIFDELDIADCPVAWRPVTRQSLLDMPKWKQKKLLEGLKKRPNVVYTFPHEEIQPTSLDQIDWGSGIVGIEKSRDGAVGVYFVELPEKIGIVLKFPHNSCPEVYGERLCRRCGIRAPATMLVGRASDQVKRFKKKKIFVLMATNNMIVHLVHFFFVFFCFFFLTHTYQGLSILHACLRYLNKRCDLVQEWWQLENDGINVAKTFCHGKLCFQPTCIHDPTWLR